MLKRAAVLVACSVALAIPKAADAGSIPTSTCSFGLNILCDVHESDANGDPASDVTVSPIDFLGFDPLWLTGYTFLLEPGTGYTGVADNGNISDVVFITSTFVRLVSDDDPGFAAAIAAALAASDQGQIIGTPFFTGAAQFQAVGLVNEDATGLAVLPDIFFAGGAGDQINIHSDVPTGPVNPPEPGVPEPTTIVLVATGLAGAAIRRRKQA